MREMWKERGRTDADTTRVWRERCPWCRGLRNGESAGAAGRCLYGPLERERGVPVEMRTPGTLPVDLFDLKS
jgi:hypothetical protein